MHQVLRGGPWGVLLSQGQMVEQAVGVMGVGRTASRERRVVCFESGVGV